MLKKFCAVSIAFAAYIDDDRGIEMEIAAVKKMYSLDIRIIAKQISDSGLFPFRKGKCAAR